MFDMIQKPNEDDVIGVSLQCNKTMMSFFAQQDHMQVS